MMERNEFDLLIDRIMALGVDEEKAAVMARLIGDTPELDADGKTVVRDGAGEILIRLALPW
jgi:hypothetical protein